MKQLYTIIITLFSLVTTNAQTSITGTVTNNEETPIEIASVILKGTTKGTVTNKDGKYILNNIADGTYTIEISYIGYIEFVKDISVVGNAVIIDAVLIKDTQALQEVEIIGRKNTNYRADITFAGTRTGAKIKDVAQSIAIVNKEIIKDQGLFRLNEVANNVAGVTQTRSGDDFTSRGFRVSHDYINGNRALLAPDFSSSSIATQYERIEFIKGPAAALFGNSSPGGVINAVTKKPLQEDRADVSLSYGSFETKRGTLDITGPLNNDKTLLYRTNVGWENAETFRDFQKNRSILFAPSLSYLPTKKTSFNVDIVGTFNNDDAGVDRGTPILQNDLFALPISFSAAEPFDNRQNSSVLLTVSANHKFSDALSLNVSYTRSDFNQNFIETRSANRFTDDGTELVRQITDRTTRGFSDFVTAYLVGKFKTGKLNHEAILGWDYYGTSEGLSSRIAVGEVYGVPNLSFNNRVLINNISELAVTFSDQATLINAINQTRGYYIQDLISVGKLKVLGALRYENLDQGNLGAADIGFENSIDNKIFLPRLGLTYEVNDQINIFASYTEAFEPQTIPNGTNNLPNGVLDPLSSNQIEVGTKTTFFNDRLLAQLSVYSINRSGRLIEDPNSGVGFVQVLQIGDETSRGLELDVTGRISRNFTLTANYAFNDVDILDDSLGRLNIDSNNPQHTAGFWGKYSITNGFLKNLGIGAGANYVSESQIANFAVNRISDFIDFPSYFTARAGVFYKYENFDLTLNVNNAFDERFFIGGIDAGRVFAGAPRNFLFTIGYKL